MLFEIGDKVRCISTPMRKRPHELIVGEAYIVSGYSKHSKGYVCVTAFPTDVFWREDRFILEQSNILEEDLFTL